MSKKQKRKVSTGTRQPVSSPAEAATQPETRPTPPRTSNSKPSSSSTPSRWSGSTPASGSRRFIQSPEFKPDYSHVIKDLKRIGILAGSFFAVLIVLSFIIK